MNCRLSGHLPFIIGRVISRIESEFMIYDAKAATAPQILPVVKCKFSQAISWLNCGHNSAGRKRTHVLFEKSGARSSRCFDLSLLCRFPAKRGRPARRDVSKKAGLWCMRPHSRNKSAWGQPFFS